MREAIAEWTVSIGSHSELISGGDIFEAIHQGFGSLEVTDSHKGAAKEKADMEWRKQRELFSGLLRSWVPDRLRGWPTFVSRDQG